ncbi:MAG: A24 family peptidase [Hydrogenovibrio sp.]|nr:A24 family peptidase [Hydrogenovibrio sp.]
MTEPQLLLFAALLGLIVGSFLSMLTWRLPRIMHLPQDKQFLHLSLTRSKCPHCETALSWTQLFPLVSWLAAKGKCRHCQTGISLRYPLIELTTLFLTTWTVWYFGATPMTLIALTFVWFIIALTVIDIEHQLILDSLSLPLLWLGLIFNSQSTFTSPADAIIGAVMGYLLLWFIFYAFKIFTGKEGMGFGDFKLLAALGAWFGTGAIPQIILIASLGSILVAVLLGILRVRKLDAPMPFGPFLALGGLISLYWGEWILASI